MHILAKGLLSCSALLALERLAPPRELQKPGIPTTQQAAKGIAVVFCVPQGRQGAPSVQLQHPDPKNLLQPCQLPGPAAAAATLLGALPESGVPARLAPAERPSRRSTRCLVLSK